MRRFWPLPALAAMLFLSLPNGMRAQSSSVSVAVSSPSDSVVPFLAAAPDIPPAMRELMTSSWKSYLEGSSLIKSGDSSRARIAFNRAVDMLLLSEWDLAGTSVLQRYLQDLIRRIHQDESNYLLPLGSLGEESEEAVVDELARLDLIPISIDPSLEHLVEADLANTRYDIPITLNEKVLQSLNYWLNKGRKYFAEGLMRSGRYREMIERIFREENIPLDLMFLAQVESLFKTNALSRQRARGIWQFGRWTAVRYGLKVNSYVDERSDPEKSTRAAARYLNDLYGMFNDWNLVLAAYNWGEANVQRLIERSGLNDFWDLTELKRKLPRETKNHVPLIQASVILARNPEKYGLPTRLDTAVAVDRVSVPHSIDLRLAARILGTTVDELKQLNPALRGLSTPPNYPDFELKLPAGSDAGLRDKVAALPAVRIPPPVESSGRYKVRPGDTLSSIAARYHISVVTLQEANDIESPRSLQAGRWLRVPIPRSNTARPKITSQRLPSTPIPSSLRKSSSAPSGKASAAAVPPPKTQSAVTSRKR